MSLIFNKIIFIFLFFNTGFSKELDCINGKIEQTSYGKLITEQSSFCFNDAKNLLISKECYKNHCEKELSKRKFTIDELYSEIGKPGFRLCRNLKGNPQIITFYVEKKAFKLDRCLFSNGNYVDTDYLLSIYLDR